MKGRVGEYLSKKLWTLHTSDFSLTKGRVDHNKSVYYRETPGVKKAYPELWRRQQILDGQVVWCYTDESKIAKHGIGKVKWELCVPDSEIICFIDDLVWNRILEIECAAPYELRRKWRSEALEKFPDDLTAANTYEESCRRSFWDQEPKNGCWWDELFTKNTGNGATALVRHPIPSEWISGHEIWCC